MMFAVNAMSFGARVALRKTPSHVGTKTREFWPMTRSVGIPPRSVHFSAIVAPLRRTKLILICQTDSDKVRRMLRRRRRHEDFSSFFSLLLTSLADFVPSPKR